MAHVSGNRVVADSAEDIVQALRHVEAKLETMIRLLEKLIEAVERTDG